MSRKLRQIIIASLNEISLITTHDDDWDIQFILITSKKFNNSSEKDKLSYNINICNKCGVKAWYIPQII